MSLGILEGRTSRNPCRNPGKNVILKFLLNLLLALSVVTHRFDDKWMVELSMSCLVINLNVSLFQNHSQMLI